MHAAVEMEIGELRSKYFMYQIAISHKTSSSIRTKNTYLRVQVSGAEQYSVSVLHRNLTHLGLHEIPSP
jgi:hypothetical protein